MQRKDKPEISNIETKLQYMQRKELQEAEGRYTQHEEPRGDESASLKTMMTPPEASEDGEMQQ